MDRRYRGLFDGAFNPSQSTLVVSLPLQDVWERLDLAAKLSDVSPERRDLLDQPPNIGPLMLVETFDPLLHTVQPARYRLNGLADGTDLRAVLAHILVQNSESLVDLLEVQPEHGVSQA